MKRQNLESNYQSLYGSDMKHLEKNLRSFIKAKEQESRNKRIITK